MAAFHVFWREFRSYFFSPVAYFAMLGFLLFNGYIFWLLLSWQSSQPGSPATVDPLTILMSGLIFMITAAGFIPMVTMRLFAEEKRTGTLEQLLTAPVTDLQLVVGKFLAAWAFYLSLWVPTLVYMWILLANFDAPMDLGPVWACYIGLSLMSFGFIAVGTMFSSFTSNQMMAFGLTFAFLVVTFFLGFAADQVPNKFFSELFAYVGTHRHMDDFSRGVVDLKAVAYYLSLGFLALFITVQSLESRKWR
ncbi:MAG: ABC transporter permease [Candidatus Brocadiia bacterium]